MYRGIFLTTTSYTCANTILITQFRHLNSTNFPYDNQAQPWHLRFPGPLPRLRKCKRAQVSLTYHHFPNHFLNCLYHSDFVHSYSYPHHFLNCLYHRTYTCSFHHNHYTFVARRLSRTLSRNKKLLLLPLKVRQIETPPQLLQCKGELELNRKW